MKIKKILLVMLVLGILAAGVGWYLIQKKLAPAEAYIKNCNNARRIYEQLVEFDKDYLELPSAEAREGDEEMSSLDLSSSNGYLGQLVIASAMDSEALFYIEGASCCSATAPDDVVTPRSEVLRAGENGWAYFKGRDLAADKSLPILAPGWNPKTKKWDESIWEKGTPVLLTDGSVSLYRAPADGKDGDYPTKKSELPFDKSDANLIQPATK